MLASVGNDGSSLVRKVYTQSILVVIRYPLFYQSVFILKGCFVNNFTRWCLPSKGLFLQYHVHIKFIRCFEKLYSVHHCLGIPKTLFRRTLFLTIVKFAQKFSDMILNDTMFSFINCFLACYLYLYICVKNVRIVKFCEYYFKKCSVVPIFPVIIGPAVWWSPCHLYGDAFLQLKEWWYPYHPWSSSLVPTSFVWECPLCTFRKWL